MIASLPVSLPVPIAAIQVDFDPLLRLGEIAVRWQTVGVALALLVGVALAARGRLASGPVVEAQPLRLDDMALVLIGALPGAVVVGRLVHGLVNLPAYAGRPEALLDPAAGSLSLLGAVIGGTATAAAMARVLQASVGRWADAAAVPLLVTLGLAKLAQFLGGSGQGAPSGSPWAVAFAGDWPWVSANPALPAHAAQVYEGGWLLLGALLVLTVGRTMRGGAARAGRLFLLALAVFAVGRVVVGFSWRDPAVVGPLNAEQLAAVGVLVALVLAPAASSVRTGRARYRERLQGTE